MARPRKTTNDNWMPPGVRVAKGRYILRSKLTDGKERRLCSDKATRSQVWAAYESLTNNDANNLGALCTEYRKSPVYYALSPATQELYRHCHNNLKKITFNGGVTFLSIQPERITPGVLRQILDLRAAQDAAVMGNREIKGFLSAVYAWALERDKITMAANPCHAVRRNEEKSRTRYVEDWEYNLALKHAGWLAPVMELAYLLYARISEVINLTRQDIRPEGIYVKRLKGSKSNIVKWSPRIREAIKQEGVVSSIYMVHKNGKRITYGMIRKPWEKMMETAKKENPAFQPFTRHDLKAKGVSDNELPQNSAGHRTKQSEEVYKRKVEKVEPPR